MVRLLAAFSEPLDSAAFGLNEAAPTPIYQKMLSFVRKKQLGGQGYQDPDSPLEPYTVLLKRILQYGFFFQKTKKR